MNTQITPQRNHPGLWVSPVIEGRWQILESQISRGEYYIWDHSADDLVRNRDRTCRYWPSRAAARQSLEPAPQSRKKRARNT